MFGAIRSQGARNINPSCASFRAALKTLIINNFMLRQSPGSNCEEDGRVAALSNLHEYIYYQEVTEPNNPHVSIDFDIQIPETNLPFLSEQLHTYMAGWMSKKLLKVIRVCMECRAALVSPHSNETDYIHYRSYSRKALLRPHTKFAHLFSLCAAASHVYLPMICTDNNVSAKLRLIYLKFIQDDVHLKFECQKHNVLNMFVNSFSEFYIFLWISNVNNILKGVESHHGNVNDEIKKLAEKRYSTYKKRKTAVDEMKKLQL